MTDIIDLAAERERRDAPDADCVKTGPDGAARHLFAVDFRRGAEVFTVAIWARDFDEAEAMVGAIRDTATLAGQIFSRGQPS